MGQRRRAREATLQILYQLDVQPDLRADVALGRFFANFAAHEAGGGGEGARGEVPSEPPVFPAEVKGHVERLVQGVVSHLAEIDARITRASRNWRLERMARVDRNLLRLAVYEMAFTTDVPGKVAINEAIEIAKRFGTQETPAFVNGILDRVLTDRGGPDPTSEPR